MKKTGLQTIPGVGPNMEEHLRALGYESPEALRGADPEEMYLRDCLRCGGTLDRCVLYVYRCAVYFAETPEPEREKCDWWYWKDRPYPPERGA